VHGSAISEQNITKAAQVCGLATLPSGRRCFNGRQDRSLANPIRPKTKVIVICSVSVWPSVIITRQTGAAVPMSGIQHPASLASWA